MSKSSKRDQFEFLPAAIEIQETPPAPVGRTVLWLIILFFLIAVTWALIGKIDIVATAKGKIIPSGHVKVIQPLEIGVVRHIRVTEGQEVAKGDVLVELDPTSTSADRERLSNELLLADLERARLKALLTIVDREDKPPDFPSRGDVAAQITNLYEEEVSARTDQPPARQVPTGAALDVQVEILSNQYSEHQLRLVGLDQDLKRQQASLVTIKTQVRKLRETLPLVTRRTQAMKVLVDKSMAAELDYLTLEQERVEQKQDLAAEKSRLREAEAGLAASKTQRLVAEAEFKRARLLELAEAERKSAGLLKEIVKATQRTNLQQLSSPISGIVENLAIHTTGGVVTPAQELMQIVPIDNQLEVEAWVRNKDIGFVREGQKAEVKVETFPFTKYGTIDAEIEDLSNDAISDKQLGLVYAARVLLEKSVVQVEDRLVNLSPGMAVTVEVKTGKRRIVEFVLSPLLRGIRESGRER
jgi:hemolysin D